MTNYGVVVIDDLRSFRENLTPELRADLVLRTEKDALAWAMSLTAADTITQLWFDHDLGEDEDGRVTSTIPIVNHIEKLAFFDEAPEIHQILVHTSNTVGGNAIVAALSRFFPTVRVNASPYFLVS